jgi:hypothetical protein
VITSNVVNKRDAASPSAQSIEVGHNAKKLIATNVKLGNHSQHSATVVKFFLFVRGH